MLQGHPRPWPVAKPRTLRVPAHKVPYVRRVSVLLRLSFARAFGGELRGLPPPALRSGQRRRLPLALLTTDLLPCPALRAGSLPLCQSAAKTSLSAHFRPSSSKVSRLAACVKYSTPLPLGRCVPLITAVLFASFFESRQKGRQQPRLNRGLMLGRCAKLIVVAHSEGGGVVYLFFVWIPACAGIFCAFLCASGCASWVCK